MSTKSLFASLVLALAGCTSESPLVYVSQQTVGIEISSSPESVKGTIVVGYKSLDVAYVPITNVISSGNLLHPIRGCYEAGQNVGLITRCSQQSLKNDLTQGNGKISPPEVKGSPQSTSSSENLLPLRSNPTTHFQNPNQSDRNGFNAFNVQAIDPTEMRVTNPIQPSLDPTEGGDGTGAEDTSKAYPPVSALDPLAIDPVDVKKGTSSNQNQSISDALSVFGSFDTSAKAGSTSGVTIGKIFATGVAAQHLTEGINLEQRRKAYAEVLQRRTDCITALKTTFGDSVKESMLDTCL